MAEDYKGIPGSTTSTQEEMNRQQRIALRLRQRDIEERDAEMRGKPLSETSKAFRSLLDKFF